DFRRTYSHHVFVVERFVVDVAGNVLLFQAADAVLESRGSGDGPRAGQGLRVAFVRQVAVGAVFLPGEVHGKTRDFVDRGYTPRLGTVGEVAVRKKNDRNHVFDGQARGFKSNPETIGRSGGGDDRNRRFRVATVKGLQEVGLLGFRGQPR